LDLFFKFTIGDKSGHCFLSTACSPAFGQRISATELQPGKTASGDLTSLLGNVSTHPVLVSMFWNISLAFLCRWLGKNSSQQKFFRLLKEIHQHMSLRISGSKNEFRETYLPVLKKRLIAPLATEGSVSFFSLKNEKQTNYSNSNGLLVCECRRASLRSSSQWSTTT